ncbi:hypothetical protein [Streptomyces sp. CMB-StM0423]|uniref:hypothetical protein n=1 Tax=Streptomyces sp. CMB-StM0423 TaxID=2059884 RepID=UPI00131DAA1E|nr:hypothetical protein [Streptomyces sp. CMB-StM0423]
MKRECGFDVLEYVTLTKDPHTELVVAIGGTYMPPRRAAQPAQPPAAPRGHR